MEDLEELGLTIFNSGIAGDENGEFTYTGGRGNTVIDYVMGREEVRRKVKWMRVEDRMESDHHPIVVCVEAGREGKKGVKGGSGSVKSWVWD